MLGEQNGFLTFQLNQKGMQPGVEDCDEEAGEKEYIQCREGWEGLE